MRLRSVTGLLIILISLSGLIFINTTNLFDRSPFENFFADSDGTFGSGSAIAIVAKSPVNCRIRIPGIYDLSRTKALFGFYSDCEKVSVHTSPGRAVPVTKNCLSATGGWRFMTPAEDPGSHITLTNKPSKSRIWAVTDADIPFRDCFHAFELVPLSKMISFSDAVWDIEISGLESIAYRGNAGETTANIVERTNWEDGNEHHAQISVFYSSRMLSNVQSVLNILLSVMAGIGVTFLIDSGRRDKRL
jgi:hypothetical protein